MNRIIKFRAWNGKEMYYTENSDSAHLDYFPLRALLGHNNNFEWMQFTGLKDKNGIEIYEGDIVINPYFITPSCKKCGHSYYPKSPPTVVKFEDGKFTLPYIDFGQQYEVIGNIYENPELLNNGK